MTRRQKAEKARTEAPPVPHPRRRPTWLLLPAAGVVAAILAGVLIWQTGSDGERTSPGVPASDPGPVHVHGLGIDPADGALFIATHTGLFRVGKSERQASRVTDRRQDTMGFTVVGPHRFLGSGHPDVREAREQGLPPLLGLIESTDAGESWRPISLRGEADFHVLRFAGERVYGYDATNDRLLVSTDRGRTWQEIAKPGAIVDTAPDPSDGRRLVATAVGRLEQGLYESRDAGESWRRLAGPVGLLAWPTPSSLYVVGEDGRVLRSLDGGRRLQYRGSIGGRPAALLAQGPEDLYVALHDGTIKHSTDGGRHWVTRSAPA